LTSQVWCEKKNPINFTPLTHHWLPNLVEGEIPQFQQLPMDSDDISSSPVRSATCHLYPGFFSTTMGYIYIWYL
jgi:hypothetical protein